MKKPSAKNKKSAVALNKRASFDIAVDTTYEAGIALTGDEIKSVRADRVQLQSAYVRLLYGNNKPVPRVALIGMHLALAHDPQRTRYLLLHEKEIRELEAALSTKGKTAVPLSLKFHRGWLKVIIGVGTGRKAYNKRELIKERDLDREQRASLKRG